MGQIRRRNPRLRQTLLPKNNEPNFGFRWLDNPIPLTKLAISIVKKNITELNMLLKEVEEQNMILQEELSQKLSLDLNQALL